jgi:hypothetical protein
VLEYQAFVLDPAHEHVSRLQMKLPSQLCGNYDVPPRSDSDLSCIVVCHGALSMALCGRCCFTTETVARGVALILLPTHVGIVSDKIWYAS